MSLDYAGHIARDAVINGRRKRGYAGYVEELRPLREAHYRQFLEGGEYRFPAVDEVIAAFDAPPPEDLSFPYSLSPDQVARLEQQLQQAERHQVDLRLAKKQLEREEKPEGVGDAKQLTSTELDAAILGAIRGFATGLSGRSEHGGETRAAGTADGVPDPD